MYMHHVLISENTERITAALFMLGLNRIVILRVWFEQDVLSVHDVSPTPIRQRRYG